MARRLNRGDQGERVEAERGEPAPPVAAVRVSVASKSKTKKKARK